MKKRDFLKQYTAGRCVEFHGYDDKIYYGRIHKAHWIPNSFRGVTVAYGIRWYDGSIKEVSAILDAEEPRQISRLKFSEPLKV